MKKIIFILCLFLLGATSLSAQEITGTWNGTLDLPGAQKLRVVFHIEKSGDGFKTLMDSPDQNLYGIPVRETAFSDDKLDISVPELGMTYEATLDGGKLKGTFKQSGFDIPLDCEKADVEKAKKPKSRKKQADAAAD